MVDWELVFGMPAMAIGVLSILSIVLYGVAKLWTFLWALLCVETQTVLATGLIYTFYSTCVSTGFFLVLALFLVCFRDRSKDSRKIFNMPVVMFFICCQRDRQKDKVDIGHTNNCHSRMNNEEEDS